eukprot:gene814-1130_t
MAAASGHLDVWQQLVANSELWPLLQPGQPMETLCNRPDLGVVRVAAALGEHWVVKLSAYGDLERQLQGWWLEQGVVFQVQEDAGLSLDRMCQQPGWASLPLKEKVEAAEHIIADGCTAQACNVNRKHSDVKLANLCIRAGDQIFQRSLCTTVDQGGSSPDDGISGAHLETTDITPEPGLAAPSSIGPGKVYHYPLESITATTAKADVSALGFSALELLLPGGLPEAMTMRGVLGRGVSTDLARPAAAPETADAQVQTDLLHKAYPGPLGVQVSWSSSPAVQAGCSLLLGESFQDWVTSDGDLSSHVTWSGPGMDHQALAVLAATGSIVPGQAARAVTCASRLKAVKKGWRRCCRVLKGVLHLPCATQA